MVYFFFALLWVGVTLFVVTIATLLTRSRGPACLIGMYTALVIISTITATKLITIFGLVVPAGVLVFAATFLITDILSECYDKRTAQTAVYVGFVAMIVYSLYSYVTVMWPGASFWGHQEAYETIIRLSIRIAIAGPIAFIISQTHDVFLFHALNGLPPFYVPVVMRVSCTYSPCLEEGGA